MVMDVLLIEDDPQIRELLVELLHEAGLHVVEMADGERLFDTTPGVGALGAEIPRIIVTDVDLGAGRHSGIEVAEQARRRWPEVGVVFITARVSNLSGRRLGRLDRLLPKPFPCTSLVQAIAGLLRACGSGSAPPVPHTSGLG